MSTFHFGSKTKKKMNWKKFLRIKIEISKSLIYRYLSMKLNVNVIFFSSSTSLHGFTKL